MRTKVGGIILTFHNVTRINETPLFSLAQRTRPRKSVVVDSYRVPGPLLVPGTVGSVGCPSHPCTWPTEPSLWYYMHLPTPRVRRRKVIVWGYPDGQITSLVQRVSRDPRGSVFHAIKIFGRVFFCYVFNLNSSHGFSHYKLGLLYYKFGSFFLWSPSESGSVLSYYPSPCLVPLERPSGFETVVYVTFL